MLLSYLNTEKDLTRKKGFYLAFIFLIGLTISYSALGLIGFFAANIAQIGVYLYYIIGIAMVLFGLHFSEIIKLKLPTGSSRFDNFRKIYLRYRGGTGTFIMGLVFGLLICPCCLPGLLGIFALTFAKGKLVYGASLVFIYTIGHGIPLLIIGTSAGAIRKFEKIQRWSSYINLVSGILMVIVGLLFIWIA
jgi:cytochrome c-type biogenesis protein